MTDPLLTLLDIDAQVRRDQDQTPAFLHRRDRRFAIACHERGETPGLRAWLDHLAGLSDTAVPPARRQRQPDPRLQPWRRLTVTWCLAGAVLGVTAMLGLLFYDGSQQINVTVILAFIALQLLLALLTSGFALANRQPWGRLLEALLAKWRQRSGQQSPPPILRQLQPQLAARVAHLGGLVFAVSAWLTLLVLVVIQDLAFGWSTTLDTAAASYHRLILTLATPWQALWPAAVPSLELVTESRFFRLGGAGADAGRWGDWWPFVAMAWLFYAVLPRLLLLALATGHLRWRVRRLLQRHPGVLALQYRMETPALEVGTGAADSHHQPDLGQGQSLADWPEQCHALVRWAGAGEPGQARLLLTAGEAPLVDAGGALSLAQDRQALARVGSALPETGGGVLVLTRAWEPPTAELADFLQDARQLWPERCRITLVPVLEDLAARPPGHQLAQWQRFVERHPALRLQTSHPHEWLNPPTQAAARVATAGYPEGGA